MTINFTGLGPTSNKLAQQKANLLKDLNFRCPYVGKINNNPVRERVASSHSSPSCTKLNQEKLIRLQEHILNIEEKIKINPDDINLRNYLASLKQGLATLLQ